MLENSEKETLLTQLQYYIEIAKLTKVETNSDALAASKHVHLVNNLVILLFILPASNAKGERAFSILEIIKSKGRAAMTQEVTSNLSTIKDNRAGTHPEILDLQVKFAHAFGAIRPVQGKT